jgi:thymidylate synthase ThyX
VAYAGRKAEIAPALSSPLSVGTPACRRRKRKMTHSARVLADSLSPDGVRLTTLEVTFPRIVLAESNTHRMLSRNSASSRAIPIEKLLRRVMDDPYIPSEWGSNQKGMQAGEEVCEESVFDARVQWLLARDDAVERAKDLLDIGIHKQLTNRLLEPFMWHTVIITATEWSNFFNLRCHPHAHPDIRIAAEKMREAMDASTPESLDCGHWHLPLVSCDEFEGGATPGIRLNADGMSTSLAAVWEYWRKVSVGRCARVSYLTHDGKRDPEADIALHDRLLSAGHMSPFEHVARPARLPNDFKLGSLSGEVVESLWWDASPARDPKNWFFGNFRGWVQHRKEISGEADILAAREAERE